jgi:predicted nucleic acid-binding Zn ribbon protein
MICTNCREHLVWIGCTPTGDKYMGCKCVTPSLMVLASPVQGVTCVVCGIELSGYSNKKTCSNRCRVHLHRKLNKVSRRI